MTVILSECTGLDITSSLFVTYLGSPADYSLVFNSSINCCDTVYTEELTSDDITVDTVTITPTTFSADEFISGVYSLEIVLVETGTGTTQTDRLCFFIDCANTLYTAVCTHLVTDLAFKSNVDRLYQALTYTSQCEDCDCIKACLLYDALIDALSLNLAQLKKDCGCTN